MTVPGAPAERPHQPSARLLAVRCAEDRAGLTGLRLQGSVAGKGLLPGCQSAQDRWAGSGELVAARLWASGQHAARPSPLPQGPLAMAHLHSRLPASTLVSRLKLCHVSACSGTQQPIGAHEELCDCAMLTHLVGAPGICTVDRPCRAGLPRPVVAGRSTRIALTSCGGSWTCWEGALPR